MLHDVSNRVQNFGHLRDGQRLRLKYLLNVLQNLRRQITGQLVRANLSQYFYLDYPLLRFVRWDYKLTGVFQCERVAVDVCVLRRLFALAYRSLDELSDAKLSEVRWELLYVLRLHELFGNVRI